MAFNPEWKNNRKWQVQDGKIRLWDTETGTLRKTLTGPKGGLRTLVFSPDGKDTRKHQSMITRLGCGTSETEHAPQNT